MKAVADTSSLIHPAKVSPFWKLMKDTFEKILIPQAVHNEILKGKDIGGPDVPVIEAAIKEAWIVSKRSGPRQTFPAISAKEKEKQFP